MDVLVAGGNPSSGGRDRDGCWNSMEMDGTGQMETGG